MSEQHAVHFFQLAVQGEILELLPQPGCHQVIPVKPCQWREQAHSQRVEQPCAAAGLQVLLIEQLVPLIWEAEIQEKPALAVLEQYLIPANLVYAALES